VKSAQLIQIIRSQYSLDWNGTHGVVHWARVLENGIRLASLTGARLEVVRLFAVFHDSRRLNEDHDPQHGLRGAKFAASLRGDAFHLSDSDFKLLYTACAEHTGGKTEADITIQTCWDSDRLDLGRVGIKPRLRYLCTEAAKQPDMISWAYQRSVSNFVPDLVESEWNALARESLK
jgi:uncharacterized protein